jgi:hypothetical protein
MLLTYVTKQKQLQIKKLRVINVFYAMESIRYTEIAALKDMEKGIKFCRQYGVLPSKDLKDCIYLNHKDAIVTSAFASMVMYPHCLRCKFCNKRTHITQHMVQWVQIQYSLEHLAYLLLVSWHNDRAEDMWRNGPQCQKLCRSFWIL